MEDEGYFSKVCLYRLILSLIPHLQSQECPPFSGPARALFLQDIYTLFLDRKGEVREPLLVPAISQLLSAQNNQFAKVGCLGVAYSVH